MSVIWKPPEGCRHAWPAGGDLPCETIARCSMCRVYGQLRAAKLRAGVYFWDEMSLGEIIWAWLTGKIPAR